MGTIVPRAVIEPTSLAFQASVIPFHHLGFLMSPLYPRLTLYEAPCLRGRYRLLHSSPWNAYNYIWAGTSHTQVRFNNHTACSLYKIMVTVSRVR